MKKFIIPIMLGILGIAITVFIMVFNPKANNDQKPFSNQYIAVKIKEHYPFPLLFKKGTSLKDVLQKFKISIAKDIYLGKQKLDPKTKLYEDSTLKIS